MTINFQLIGQRVKEYRCRQNLKQDELAWDANLSAPYLSCIENGVKQASLGSLVRIADALNVTIDYLLFGDISQGEDNNFRRLSAIISDCDEAERRIIMDAVTGTAEAVKRSLRENEVLL